MKNCFHVLATSAISRKPLLKNLEEKVLRMLDFNLLVCTMKILLYIFTMSSYLLNHYNCLPCQYNPVSYSEKKHFVYQYD